MIDTSESSRFGAYPSPVWRVELDPGVAVELGRLVGSERRAAEVESDDGAMFGDPVPFNARLLRVEPDEDVGVFVEATWPLPDYGYRRAMLWRYLRAAEPVKAPDGYKGPALISHVVCEMRELGALTDELTEIEVDYARREAEALREKPGGAT